LPFVLHASGDRPNELGVVRKLVRQVNGRAAQVSPTARRQQVRGIRGDLEFPSGDHLESGSVKRVMDHPPGELRAVIRQVDIPGRERRRAIFDVAEVSLPVTRVPTPVGERTAVRTPLDPGDLGTVDAEESATVPTARIEPATPGLGICQTPLVSEGHAPGFVCGPCARVLPAPPPIDIAARQTPDKCPRQESDLRHPV
jgi:hypothetical protein